MSVVAEAPWWITGATEADSAKRVKLTADTCVIDGAVFLVRGNIQLPIRGTSNVFVWGVWCSLSRESFERVLARWNSSDRDQDAPRFGWLYAQLPGYEAPTWELKTMVHQSPVGVAPWVEIEPGSHQLAEEAANGISVERWHELAAGALRRG